MLNKEKLLKIDRKVMDFIVTLSRKQFDNFILTFDDFLKPNDMETMQEYYASKNMIVYATSSNIRNKKNND